MKNLSLPVAALGGLILVGSGAYSVQVAGQQPAPPPQRSQVTIVRVKPDMIDAWIDFQTNRTIPALKKAGVTERDVYQSATGNLGEFRLVTPIGKFADRDNPGPIERALGAAGAKEYNSAYRKLIASSTTYIIQRLQDLRLDPNPNATYKVLILSTVHVLPGHAPDYVNYLKTDILPIEKKAETKRLLVSRVTFGGDNNEFRLARFTDKFADLDGGPATIRVLGPEGAAKLAQKLAGIVASTQNNVYIRNDSLSFRTRPQS